MARKRGPGWKAVITRPFPCATRFSYARYPRAKRKGRGYWSGSWEIEGLDDAQMAAVERNAAQDGYRVKKIAPSLVRDSTYRAHFLKDNPGPWRCRYCGGRIEKPSNLQIDHIIPVDAAQTSSVWRAVLFGILEAQSVNDSANLAPSCPRCNLRKGSKTGIWAVRGFLGAYPTYWAALRGLQLAAALLLLWLVLGGGTGFLAARLASLVSTL